MPEPGERLEDPRLRAALGELGERARGRVRAPGVATVAPAGRRRRARLAGGAALALVLAGGAGWWAAAQAAPSGSAAAPPCAPAEARAYLPADPTPQRRARVGEILAGSAEVAAYRHESIEENWERFNREFPPDLVNATRKDAIGESWWFSLHCAGDFPAVQARLEPAVEGVWCSCLPPDKPVRPADSPSAPS
jgi:hypothetical protein